MRGALELAVASLNEELAIEEPEREFTLRLLDRKGVPGSPDLVNVILDKIRSSDVFVADVTPVGATVGATPKKLMNANVAIDLGYALHTTTDRRMIMVMNTVFGSLTCRSTFSTRQDHFSISWHKTLPKPQSKRRATSSPVNLSWRCVRCFPHSPPRLPASMKWHTARTIPHAIFRQGRR